MIAKLICKLLGHRRGKRVKGTDTICCPRCNAQWQRPQKKAKAQA